MQKDSKIFVAGHKGMVGSAIMRTLQERGFHNMVVRTRAQLDLMQKDQVDDFFQKEKIAYVFLAAAKVGGIFANATQPADFITQNLSIQQNIITAAFQYKVKRLLFLGSSCIYPKEAPQPLKEAYLLSGYLEATNSAYAIAKIAGVEMCRSYNTQYGTQFLAAMPTNLYGKNDNYNPENSHVLPALIRKIHEAKEAQKPSVTIWGDGTPLREFLFADDLAAACIFLMLLEEKKYTDLLATAYYPLINIGSGEECSIKDLALLAAQIIGYKGTFTFDTTKPNGTMRKILDSSLIHRLGWQKITDLSAGIALSYTDFLQRKTRL